MHVVALPTRGLMIAGRYRLAHELAHGGMSSVWLAEDQLHSRSVAIKFQESLRIDESHERRFKREVRALSQLVSPHVVQVFDSGADKGLTYIVMELLSGETLRRRAEARGRLPVPDVLAVVRQAALGLSSAHAVGIVHRDVKPSNLFMATSAGGEVLKIIDFGIAKGDSLDPTLDVTASGLIGSPAYMSPEQARGETVDPRSDLWALGVVAFRLLSGHEPFAAGNVPATLQRICVGPPPRLGDFAPDLPPAFDAFFGRAFAPERRQRHQTAAAFASAFARACTGQLEEPSPSVASVSGPLAPSARRREIASQPTPSSRPRDGSQVDSTQPSAVWAFPAARAEVRVKGQSFHSVLRALVELYGEPLRAQVLETMSGDGGQALREGSLLSANFYPVAWYRELLATASRLQPGAPNLARDVGRRSGERDIAGMYKVLLRALSTEMLIKQSARLLRVVYEGGGADVLEVRHGFARVRYHDYWGFDRNVWQDAIGGAEAAFRATGARQLTITVQEGGRDGDADMVAVVTWQ